MDGVSTVISLVGSCITVVKFVKRTLADIKDAPQELQALRERLDDIDLLLGELENRQLAGLFCSNRDITVLHRHQRRVHQCLCDISEFIQGMEKVGRSGKRELKRTKWLRKGTRLDDLNGRLDKVENSLSSLFNLVISRSQAREEQSRTLSILMLQDVRLGVEQSQLQVKALKQHISTALSQTETIDMARLRNTTTTHSPLAFADHAIYPKKCSAQVPASHAHFATLAHRLHCPTDCACRCHTPFTQHTVPLILASLIGQINVSKRLLHTLRLSSWECNTQTCRRDKTVSDTVHWCLPFALFHSDWSMHVNLPSLSISIFAPRTIPPNAEAWKYIYAADLVGLRALFTARKASIYDVDEYGNTFLAVACRLWNQSQSHNALDIIRFLAQAGADLDYRPGWVVSAKTQLFQAFLAVLAEHPLDAFARCIRTDPLAIDVCHSVFGLDASDIVLDCLALKPNAEELQAALGFGVTSGQPRSLNTLDPGTLYQQLVGFTPLEYAIWYMTPADVLRRLAHHGEDASLGAPLTLAVVCGYRSLLQPLLASGADINAVNEFGFAPLHLACHHGRLEMLVDLGAVAGGGVDWHARTEDGSGMDALQVVKASPWWGCGSVELREGVLAVLRGRGLEDEQGDDGLLRMPGGFGC